MGTGLPYGYFSVHIWLSESARSLVAQRQSVLVPEIHFVLLRLLVGHVHDLDGELLAGVPVDAAPHHCGPDS